MVGHRGQLNLPSSYINVVTDTLYKFISYQPFTWLGEKILHSCIVGGVVYLTERNGPLSLS